MIKYRSFFRKSKHSAVLKRTGHTKKCHYEKYGSHMEWKTWKMRKNVPVREFHPKYWKNEGILPINRFLYFLNSLNDTLKKLLENGRKILEKSGKFISPKMWEPWEG